MKPAAKYGLINGIGLILFMLFMYVTDLNRTGLMFWLQILGLSIPVICIYFAIKEYKDKEGGGWITFGRAFKISLSISLIGYSIHTVFNVFYDKYIDPTFRDYATEKQLSRFGLTDEQIADSIEKSHQMLSTPSGIIKTYLMVFATLLFISLVISFIMAAILRKENPEEIA